MLYVIPTPIGNLKDITKRAIEVLNTVDLIICEDTRKTSILLNNLSISKQTMAYHKFNERKSCERIISLLKENKNIALVSDCGTPLICDPGQILISELNKNNLPYTVLPGPCALITGLVLSGFNSANFSFFGFLPEKNKDRKLLLEEIASFKTTLIFYVAVHALDETLDFLKNYFLNRKACLVRELSKIYEEKIYFKIGDEIDVTKKGEFILIIEGCKEVKVIKNPVEEIDKLIASGVPKNQAIGIIAKQLKIERNDLYKIYNKI